MSTVVSISSLKGGVGKTSLLLGLASAALVQGLRLLVIDCDPHGDASTGLGLVVAGPGWSGADMGAMLTNPADYKLEEEIRPSAWNSLGSLGASTQTGLEPGVFIARAAASLTAFEQLPRPLALPALSALLDEVKDSFDLILIDCPPTLGRLTETAWAASDRVLSVAEPALFSVAGSERTLRAIARFEEQTEFAVGQASIIINKVRPQDPEHIYRCEEMRVLFGDLVADITLPDTPLLQQIQGSAYPLHYWPEPESQELAQAFSGLLQGLLSQQGQEPEASEADSEQGQKKEEERAEEKA